MSEYTNWKERCDYVNSISSSLIDGFLMYYAAQKDKIDREFETRISRFKETTRQMPSSWKGMIKTQYIVHQIFKEQGLIHKYLNHAAIKARSAEEQEYLRSASSYPWRFSFSEIISNPAPDFYEMEDVFTSEVFHLYSPSVTRTLTEYPVQLWFNLIGYNGACYQTFGPVIGFKGFNADDIFFYATELEPAIQSEWDIVKHINENPVRYMMLAVGADFPLVFQQGNEMVQAISAIDSVELDMQMLRKDFKVEYAESIFKLTHKVWSESPYFAEAYFDEETADLLVFALSDKGYLELAAILNSYGLNVASEPDIRLHVSMSHVIEKVLKRKLHLNPYSHLFESQQSPESEAQMLKLNQLMALALPYINSGRQPDVAALAKEAGVDPEVAKELLEQAIGRINDLRKE